MFERACEKRVPQGIGWILIAAAFFPCYSGLRALGVGAETCVQCSYLALFLGFGLAFIADSVAGRKFYWFRFGIALFVLCWLLLVGPLLPAAEPAPNRTRAHSRVGDAGAFGSAPR